MSKVKHIGKDSTILVFDTSCAKASVAIWKQGHVTYHCSDDQASKQAELLFVLIEQAFEKTSLSYNDLDAITVVHGPGSFTGVRIAIAAAQGIALPLDIELIGVSAAQSYAAYAYHKGIKGPYTVVLDARRGQVAFLGLDKKLMHIEDPVLYDYEQAKAMIHMYDNTEFIGNALHVIDKPQDNHLDVLAYGAALAIGNHSSSIALKRLPLSPLYLREPDVG